MMVQLNHFFFLLINATPTSPKWIIHLSTFLARDLIAVIPLLLIGLWLWGSSTKISFQRKVVSKTAIALCFALLFTTSIRMLLPYARPFVEGFGYTFMDHAPNSSFPSNHGAAIFTFALAFSCWYRFWFGMGLMVVAVAIAWSRIYLGVHWPLDMVGAFMVGVVGCLFSQLIWNVFGDVIASRLTRVYRICFALPINKGWVRG